MTISLLSGKSYLTGWAKVMVLPADKDGGQHLSFHLFHAFFNKFRTDCLEGNKKVCNFATK